MRHVLRHACDSSEQELLSLLGKSKATILIYYIFDATHDKNKINEKNTRSKEHPSCYSSNFRQKSRVNFSIAMWIQLGWWPAIIANSDRDYVHWKLPAQQSESAPPLLRGSESVTVSAASASETQMKNRTLVEHNFIDETQINFNWYTVERVSRIGPTGSAPSA
jgi:hypothetical protein